MPKLPVLSSRQVIKVLCNKFHFRLMNSKGSHLTLIETGQQHPALLIVPVHDQIRTGTLVEILRKARIEREAFLQAIED